MPRTRGMFIRRKRRRWILPLATLTVIAGSVAGLVMLKRGPTVAVQGEVTVRIPLACTDDSPAQLGEMTVAFLDSDGRELERATPSSDARTTTELVRGFAHCRITGRYQVRVPKRDAYVIELRPAGGRFGPVSYEQLAQAGFTYDLGA